MKQIEGFGKKKIIITILLVLTVLLAAIYLAIGVFFRSHFWFRTTINGVDCSGKNVAMVEQIITDEIGQYKIDIEARGGQTETIKSKDIGLKPVFDGSLEKELRSRSGFAWMVSLFRDTNIELETMVNYEDTLFEKVAAALDCMQPEQNQKPENAYLDGYQEGAGYKIVPEQEGSLLKKREVEELLHTSIINLQEKVSLEENDCYVQPEIRSDNKKLVSLQKKMNTYVATEITYEFGDATEVLSGSVFHDWLSVTGKDEIIIDQEKAAEFVKGLADKYNTAGKSRSLATAYGTTVNISPNLYGWSIDQTGETEQLLADIPTGKAVRRQPQYRQTAKSHGAQDHGGTYVEINLTAQHLFFYKDGALVVESDFVSGNEAKGCATPPGGFPVTYTQRDAVLRGPGYASPVSYWMPFNGGVGLHDATWRRDFGGNYYKASGSHGCINLPYSAAKKIYENINAGDAVFVYHLAGTESAKASAQDAAAAVDAVIQAIGEVSAGSGEAIGAARSAYDALDDMGKGFVKYYDVLVASETSYGVMAAEQEEEAQAEKAAGKVMDDISSIGEVTLDSKKAIHSARTRYDALSDRAKQKVTNLDVLTAAEDKFKELQEKE